MPDTPTPGQVNYEAFDAAFPADRFVRLHWEEQAPAVQAAWEAAAQAVQDHAHDGCDPVRVPFRYHIGQRLRLAEGTRPWVVCARRWVERAIMGPYAEYGFHTPSSSALCWEVEADLLPWEDTPC